MAELAMDIIKLLVHLVNGVIFLITLGPRLVDGLSRKVWSKAERIDSGTYNESHSVHLAFDGQGNALAVSNEYYNVYARCFTPGSGWGKPELIDHTRDSDDTSKEVRGRMNDPEAYFDDKGNALAVWDGETGYDDVKGFMHEAWCNPYSNGTGWGKAERFAHTPGESRPVKMSCDPLGNTIAVWTHFADNCSTLWAQTRAGNTKWSKPSAIAKCQGNATLMQVSFDTRGNALVLWRTDKEGKNPRGRFSVYLIYYSAATGWGKSNILSKVLDSYHMNTLKHAFDSKGNAIVVCSFLDSTDNEKQIHIWAKRYDINKGWEKAVKIDPGVISEYSGHVSESVQPKIAFDNRDNAIVVWTQVNGNERGGIWTNRYTPGQGWGKASAITKTNNDQANHQLAVDTRGNAVVIWRQRNGLAASYYTVDVGWSTPEHLYPDIGNSYSSFDPKIVFDPEGNAIAIWWYRVFLYTIIQSIQYTPGKGWGKPIPVTRDYTNKANYPLISIDTQGIAHVVWGQRDNDSSHTHYWTSHLLKARKMCVSNRKQVVVKIAD